MHVLLCYESFLCPCRTHTHTDTVGRNARLDEPAVGRKGREGRREDGRARAREESRGEEGRVMDRVQTILLFSSSLVPELISSNGATNPCAADAPDTNPLLSLLSNILFTSLLYWTQYSVPLST